MVGAKHQKERRWVRACVRVCVCGCVGVWVCGCVDVCVCVCVFIFAVEAGEMLWLFFDCSRRVCVFLDVVGVFLLAVSNWPFTRLALCRGFSCRAQRQTTYIGFRA